MNKIYKIGNKEIDGARINELIYSNSPLENTVNNLVVKNVLIQLLEALSDKEEKLCEHGNNPAKGYCLGCYNEAIKPKQPTSLKSEIQEFMDDSGYYHMGDFTIEKLIELIQSHLVKEIQKQEMPGYQDEGAEHAHAGYVRALEDIIKIINNITDQNERNN